MTMLRSPYRRIAGLSRGRVARRHSNKFLAPAAAAEADHRSQSQMEDVTPPEDLMREHGVLNRVLLVYGAAIQRFGQTESFDTSIILNRRASSATLSDYHKRDEEHFLPAFQAGRKIWSVLSMSSTTTSSSTALTDDLASGPDERHAGR